MKSNILTSTVCLAAVMLIGTVACFAQAANQDKGTPVTMKIDLVAWGPDIAGLTLGAAGNKKEYVTALAFRYSKAVVYAGSNLLEIHQDQEVAAQVQAANVPISKNDRKSGSHQPSPSPPPPPPVMPPAKAKPGDKSDVVAHAVLPLDSKRVTILLAPGKNNTYITYVIDDDPSKLPFGRLRIHNMSPLVVALRCNGKKPIEINPKGVVTVPPEKNHVIYELAYKLGETWRMQENNLLTVQDNEQAQMIILKSEDSYFVSSDGSKGGFMQMVVLRRWKEVDPPPGSAATTQGSQR